MALLTSPLLSRFPGAVVNVHPSLLPAFPGMRAIEQAIDYGVKIFGVTVHFVEDDGGVDTGPVIVQGSVELANAVDPGEVHEALRAIEHTLLPEAVRLVARGALSRDPANPRRILVAGLTRYHATPRPTPVRCTVARPPRARHDGACAGTPPRGSRPA